MPEVLAGRGGLVLGRTSHLGSRLNKPSVAQLEEQPRAKGKVAGPSPAGGNCFWASQVGAGGLSPPAAGSIRTGPLHGIGCQRAVVSIACDRRVSIEVREKLLRPAVPVSGSLPGSAHRKEACSALATTRQNSMIHASAPAAIIGRWRAFYAFALPLPAEPPWPT